MRLHVCMERYNKGKRLLVQTCRQSHVSVSVCLSVCPGGVLWQNGSLDLDVVWRGECGRPRDGCLRQGSKGKGRFEGKCGESHCNQRDFVAWLFSALKGGDAALTQITFGRNC